MIGITDQYLLKFSVAGSKTLTDFIDDPDLISFKLIEEAGNLLPIFELAFYVNEEEIFQVLHEGNDLDCTFGTNENNSFSCKLTVTKSSTSKSGTEKRIVYLAGMYSVIPYITNSKMFISDYKSAIEVMIDKAKSNFGIKNVISNITKSNDKQRWIQPNSSDKKFINELWLHADLPNSFPAIGITSAGNFIIKDIVKDVQQGEDTLMWNFLPSFKISNNPKDKDISYDGNATIETNTGFINNWIGYGKELHELNLDTSSDSKILETADPVIAMSKRMAKRIEIDKKFASIGFKNENVHENYWTSYQKNIASLASFQNIKVAFSFQSYFKHVKILDKVYFSEGNISGVGSADFSAGIYYITKVSRNITHRMLSTTVFLQRETLNSIKTSN